MQNNLSGEDLVSNVSTPELIQALQLVVVGYFLGAMILRFVFPAFSMERDTAWSIITAPLSRNRLFWAKAGFFVLIFSVISLLIGVVHVSILAGSLASTISFLVYTLIISITLTLTGLALGARFPNFTTADPEKLSTTLPGLGFIAIAVVYSSACAYGYYLLASGQPVVAVMGVILLSLLLATITTVSALHKLPTTDFTARVES